MLICSFRNVNHSCHHRIPSRIENSGFFIFLDEKKIIFNICFALLPFNGSHSFNGWQWRITGQIDNSLTLKQTLAKESMANSAVNWSTAGSFKNDEIRICFYFKSNSARKHNTKSVLHFNWTFIQNGVNGKRPTYILIGCHNPFSAISFCCCFLSRWCFAHCLREMSKRLLILPILSLPNDAKPPTKKQIRYESRSPHFHCSSSSEIHFIENLWKKTLAILRSVFENNELFSEVTAQRRLIE